MRHGLRVQDRQAHDHPEVENIHKQLRVRPRYVKLTVGDSVVFTPEVWDLGVEIQVNVTRVTKGTSWGHCPFDNTTVEMPEGWLHELVENGRAKIHHGNVGAGGSRKRRD